MWDIALEKVGRERESRFRRERLMKVFRHSSNYNTNTRYPNHAAVVNAVKRGKEREGKRVCGYAVCKSLNCCFDDG